MRAQGSTAARRSDSGRVLPGYDAGKTEHPTGGAHASVREEGRKARSGLGREMGRRMRETGRGKVFLGRGVKEKKKEMGWGRKRKCFVFF